MDSVNVCLGCGTVASGDAKFCSNCGSAVTLIRRKSETSGDLGFSGLVQSDNASEWSHLFAKLQTEITQKSSKFLGTGWRSQNQGSTFPSGTVFLVEIEDDPWNVSVPLPDGTNSEAWAGCYLKIAEKVESGQQFLVSSSKAFLSVAPSGFLITYAVIPCPRCESLFLRSSEHEDESYEREYASPDCVACNGSGEWVLGA